jgi:hypothetical protein
MLFLHVSKNHVLSTRDWKTSQGLVKKGFSNSKKRIIKETVQHEVAGRKYKISLHQAYP